MGTAILTSSGGGHLSELVRLQPRLAGFDRICWAVPDSDQTRSLLDQGRADWVIENIPDLGSRDLRGALQLLGPAARLIRREAPSLVLSTGAAPAVPFLVQAARRRIPAYYVESLARLSGPSLSGKILRRVPGVQLRTQHESLDWPGWRSVGLGVEYQPEARPLPDRPLRVVVTVGTRPFDFRRLFERLVQILPDDAQVTWQVGHSNVAGLHLVGARSIIPPDEMRQAMHQADVIVAHGGVGSAFDALDAGRLPVLVPRRLARGEHVDDHQVQVASWLARIGLALAPEVEDLAMSHVLDAAATEVVITGPPSPLPLE